MQPDRPNRSIDLDSERDPGRLNHNRSACQEERLTPVSQCGVAILFQAIYSPRTPPGPRQNKLREIRSELQARR